MWLQVPVRRPAPVLGLSQGRLQDLGIVEELWSYNF